MCDTKSLAKQGWFVTEEALEECKRSRDNPNMSDVIKYFLNKDMKEYGAGWLPERGKLELVTGPGVVQVIKVRNVGAPKDDEENKTSPRLLRITLSDGKTNISALDLHRHNKLSLDTVPGTKLLLRGKARVRSGFVLLEKDSIDYLGGKVEELARSWALRKSLVSHSQNRQIVKHGDGGPPPFTDFGSKNKPPTTEKASNFRAMERVGATKAGDEDEDSSAFVDKRQAEIEVLRQVKGEAPTRKFLPSHSKLMQKEMEDGNVARLVDMGFSARDADAALKQTQGHMDHAMDLLLSGALYSQVNLGGARGRGAPPEDTYTATSTGGDMRRGRGGRGRRRGRGGRFDDDEDDYSIDTGPVQRPSGPSTLGDFLAAKLGAPSEPTRPETARVASSGGGHDQIRTGSHCTAQWMDGRYYPVTVRQVLPTGHVVVFYEEFGEAQTVPLDLMRTVDGHRISPQNLVRPVSAAPAPREDYNDRYDGRGDGGGYYRGRGGGRGRSGRGGRGGGRSRRGGRY